MNVSRANDSELTRRDFLLNRDGLQGTIKFYEQAIGMYTEAHRMALKPRKPNERISSARGKEWAEIYSQAVTECSQILDELRHKPTE